jgi:phage anti-repressor protein/phage antirepressor YoqD-like protein
MKELITIQSSTISEQQIKTVDARELHSFLEIGKDFSTWIKGRIKSYGFVESVDYVTDSRSPVLGSGNRGASTDYHLTLDMAKEISMVERNSRGKQARLYFIECEKFAQQIPVDPMKALNDPAAMRGLLLSYSEKVLELETENKEMAPKVEGFERIAGSDGLTCITDTAKSLQMRPKDLFSWLSTNKWIYRRAGGKGWLAYQSRIQQGVLTHKVTTVSLSDGQERIVESVKVTPKGLAMLSKVFVEVAA